MGGNTYIDTNRNMFCLYMLSVTALSPLDENCWILSNRNQSGVHNFDGIKRLENCQNSWFYLTSKCPN